MSPLSWNPLPSPFPSHPSWLSQSPGLSSLNHKANSHKKQSFNFLFKLKDEIMKQDLIQCSHVTKLYKLQKKNFWSWMMDTWWFIILYADVYYTIFLVFEIKMFFFFCRLSWKRWHPISYHILTGDWSGISSFSPCLPAGSPAEVSGDLGRAGMEPHLPTQGEPDPAAVPSNSIFPGVPPQWARGLGSSW